MPKYVAFRMIGKSIVNNVEFEAANIAAARKKYPGLKVKRADPVGGKFYTTKNGQRKYRSAKKK